MSATPLAGLLVVDLTRHLPGPLAARLLADLGARVIKVEEPSLGDPVRQAPPLVEGRSALAAILLAGVESLALDLKSGEARAVLEALLATADVLLESFRPGALGRLGLAPAELRRRFPRLVILSVSGWGQGGPWAARAGHDLTYQAVAGSLAPTARAPAVPVADHVGGWAAATAVLAALYERQRTGDGAWIDAALLDAGAHANLVNWAAEAGGRHDVGEPLGLSGALPCYAVYRTRDGRALALAALEPHFWRRFCDATGRRDLRRRQYDRTPAARRAVAELVAGRTSEEWLAILRARDIPGETVLAAREALDHPQVRRRAVVETGDDGLPRLGFPALFDGARPRAAASFPELGAHTRSVLAEWRLAAATLPRRQRRAAGIGPRFSWRRLLARLFGGILAG